jgi:hypothetical protein
MITMGEHVVPSAVIKILTKENVKPVQNLKRHRAQFGLNVLKDPGV